MKQLYYSFRTFMRNKGSNLIKIISLTLGLFVGILMLARVAFEYSYDTFYEEADNLFTIQSQYTVKGVKEDPDLAVYGPLPAAIHENFPEQVKSACVSRPYGDNIFYSGNYRFTDVQMIYASTTVFETMGIQVLDGNPDDLVAPDMVFISRSFAKNVSGDESPVGKVLMLNKTYPMTIRGVFEDIPENTEYPFNLVCSFSTISKRAGRERAGWGYDISYQGYVRFNHPDDAAIVEARLPEMIRKYLPDPEEGYGVEYKFIPIKEYHRSRDDVQRMVLIMSVLAFVILLIATMNYVLASISSLNSRAKTVAVHKSNGASAGQVMNMFMYETIFIILICLLLVVLLFLNFRDAIEDMVSVSLGALFSWQNLWLPGVVLILVFLVSGIIPGRIFANIPVTQVFRSYKEKKSSWKRPLLFAQFAGVAFFFGMLATVNLQYRQVMDTDLGYNADRLAVAYHEFPDKETAKVHLKNLPYVEDLAFTVLDLISGYSGDGVDDDAGKEIFTVRMNWIDYNYVPMMGIKILEGKYPERIGELLVNEEFMKRRKWTDSPIGKRVYTGSRAYGTIVGVINDFPVKSLYQPQDPVMLIAVDPVKSIIHVRLKEPFEENLKALNKEMLEVYPSDDIEFLSFRKMIDHQYENARHFRDAVFLGSFSILLIAIMGLLGYLNDEVQRRSKEIAIRKVNGAEPMNILVLISKDILWMAVPGVVIGVVIAYIVGQHWINQFSQTIDHSPLIYIIIAISALIFILSAVIVRSWKIANEDPVKSIKSE